MALLTPNVPFGWLELFAEVIFSYSRPLRSGRRICSYTAWTIPAAVPSHRFDRSIVQALLAVPLFVRLFLIHVRASIKTGMVCRVIVPHLTDKDKRF